MGRDGTNERREGERPNRERNPRLGQYRKRRNFHRTPEPKGEAEHEGTGWRYVVQKHDARRLHYDLRLELDGVLKSWAVPKGPSFDPGEKRLAVHVEDHPLEYADFEGVIPEDEYGSGTVLVWDFGTWEAVGDPREGYRKGRLHFRLHGARLRGEWVLARMGGEAAGENRQNWLLVKIADDFAGTDRGPGENDASVLSGRPLSAIAQAPEFFWSAQGKSRAPAYRGRKRDPGAPFPEFLEPQLATLVEIPPRGVGWLHEIKFDGYRLLCRIHRGKVTLLSRNGKDWTRRFQTLSRALSALPVRDAWMDGEAAVLLPDGRTSFGALQEALSEERDGDIVYFLFDLLFRDGADLRPLPLVDRKEALKALLAQGPASSSLRFADHLTGEGQAVFSEACRLGLEGVVSKQASGAYHPGRARDWLKIKCLQRQEFVIGGFSSPTGARSGLGALLLGVYDEDRLIYAGRVGTGFSEHTLRDLHARLGRLATERPPFASAVPKGRGSVTFVEPRLVAEVAFTNWTSDGLLRQPVFQGLREDKPPREVRREGPARPPPPAEVGARRGANHVTLLRLSHPDKVLFPDVALTKQDIAHYYQSVASAILPDLVDRPLTLLRCPEGQHMPCFFQKHATEALPPGIDRIPIREKEGKGLYLVIKDLSGVMGLVQMGVLEIHTWGAHADRPDAPDRIVLDFDPDEGLSWDALLEGVQLMHELLDALELTSFLRTTGGKGLHVVAPLARRHTWEEVKTFSHALARALVHTAPRLYTTQPSMPARRGKVYIDYLRNGRGATAIANFSTRAKAGAPVAVPLAWDELGTRSDAYRVGNVAARLRQLKTDPWKGYDAARQSITKAMKRALGMA